MYKKIFFFIPFIYLFFLLYQQDNAFNQDLGRHIKTGELIVHCLCVPKINLYSYVEPNHPFINHHWFSEVIFYLSQYFFGIQSIIVIKILAIFVSFFLVWRLAYKKGGLFWTTLISIPYLFLFSYRFDSRPEVFSFVCIALFLFLIEKFRETGRLQYLLFLPFIELVWVNLHIYFIIGVILFGIFVACELYEKRLNINSRILYIFVATVVATFFNPSGIEGLLLPTTILQNYGYTIVENQSIFFLNSVLPSIYINFFELLAAVSLCSLFFAKRKSAYPIFLVLFSVIFGAVMVRNFPVFVLVTIPYGVFFCSQLGERLEHSTRNIAYTLLIAASIGIGVFTINYQMQSTISGFSFSQGATGAVDFFGKNKLRGPIFNNFDIGSYLIYRLYPHDTVYVDGRPEAYSVSFFDEYKKMQTDPIEFAKQDAQYHFQTIMFSHTDLTPWAQTFLVAMVKNPDWVPVYLDQMMVIFVKNTHANQSLIQKYKVTLPSQ